eukprot:2466524-Amphidinium_carterae.1
MRTRSSSILLGFPPPLGAVTVSPFSQPPASHAACSLCIGNSASFSNHHKCTVTCTLPFQARRWTHHASARRHALEQCVSADDRQEPRLGFVAFSLASVLASC